MAYAITPDTTKLKKEISTSSSESISSNVFSKTVTPVKETTRIANNKFSTTSGFPDHIIIKKISECGCGATATIYSVTIPNNKENFALKVHRRMKIPEKGEWKNITGEPLPSPSEISYLSMDYELMVHRNLKHRNIIQFLGRWQHLSIKGTLMPLAKQTMRDKLEQPFSLKNRIEVTFKIGEALIYMHTQGFTHNDLKPDNILFQNEEPILIDFNLSMHKSIGTEVKTRKRDWNINYTYLAPEYYFSYNHFSVKQDVFGYGYILGCLLCNDILSIMWHTNTDVICVSFSSNIIPCINEISPAEPLIGLFDVYSPDKFIDQSKDINLKDPIQRKYAIELTTDVAVPCLKPVTEERLSSVEKANTVLQKILAKMNKDLH